MNEPVKKVPHQDIGWRMCFCLVHQNNHRHFTLIFHVTVLLSHLSKSGITWWEHSKPVNPGNTAVSIHISTAALHINHTFAVEFPALLHCIIATSQFQGSTSTKQPIKETNPFFACERFTISNRKKTLNPCYLCSQSFQELINISLLAKVKDASVLN